MLTIDDFRRLCLSIPGAEEHAHFGNPDFRIKGKIFATLGGSTGQPVVKLTPDEQAMLVETEPLTFKPVEGYWGRAGATRVMLTATDEPTALNAVQRAWRNVSTPRKGKR